MTNELTDAPAIWGEREKIRALGRRFKTMLPGGENLTDEQAMALAQYSQITDSNPFRGEIYPLVDFRGKLTFVEGYKLLVRWAKGKANYTESYEQLTDKEKADTGLNPKEDIAYTCSVLRDDQKGTIKDFVNLGATFQEAYKLVATTATGVVVKSDRWSSKKQAPIPPPKGWTWHDVAKKRALKNALNLSHGAPSPQELASASWKVGETQTDPEDWENTPAYIAQEQEMHERYAQLNAIDRERREVAGKMTVDQQAERLANSPLQPPNDQDEVIGEEPAEEPEPTEKKETKNGRPYSPVELRDKLHRRVSELQATLKEEEKEATSEEIGLIRSKIAECFAPESVDSHRTTTIIEFLWDKFNLTECEVKASLVWLLASLEPDDTNDFPLHKHAPEEVKQIWEHIQQASGQLEMFDQ